MTKFKILSWFLLSLIMLSLAGIGITAYLIYDFLYDISIHATPPNLISKFSRNIVLTLIFTTGLYFIYKSCTMFISKGYFNIKSAIYLKRGGYILTTKALLGLIWTAVNLDQYDLAKKESQFSLYSGVSANITLLIIGFAIVAVSDIIQKGANIKQENDLTI